MAARSPRIGETLMEHRAVRPVVFGRRKQPPFQDVLHRQARLDALGAELALLLSAGGDVDPQICVDTSGGEPSLRVGPGGRLAISIDPVSGLYVLEVGPGGDDCLIVTASEERLLDQVVGCVAAAGGNRVSAATDSIIDDLVGCSLQDVERRLVLRTLARFRGDYQRAAAVLGVSSDALRLHIRRHLKTAPRVPSPMEGGL